MSQTVERQRQHFDSISQTYFTQRRTPNYLRVKACLLKIFFARHPHLLPRGGHVLEPMCGAGEGKEVLSAYVHPDFSYEGFDYSEQMVRLAREIHGDAVRQQDITQWQAHEKYDVILIIGGLHHVFRQTPDILRRIREALKPGGYFVSLEPTHDNWLWGKIRERVYEKNALFDAESEQGYALNELNRHYREAGLEIVDQMHGGLLAYMLYFNPDAFPRLNVGPAWLVNAIVTLEKPFYFNWLGRKLSFATFSILRRT